TAPPPDGPEAQQLRAQVRQRWAEHVRSTLGLSDDQAGKLDATERRFEEQRQRSEEHTSELQSPYDLVCRLLLEKKKKKTRQKRKQQTPPTLRLSATHRHLIITTTYRAPTNRVSLLPPPRTPLQSHTTKYTQDTP